MCLATRPETISCDGMATATATMDHATTTLSSHMCRIIVSEVKVTITEIHFHTLETHCGADRKVATVKFLRRTRFLSRLPPSDLGRKYLLKAKLTGA